MGVLRQAVMFPHVFLLVFGLAYLSLAAWAATILKLDKALVGLSLAAMVFGTYVQLLSERVKSRKLRVLGLALFTAGLATSLCYAYGLGVVGLVVSLAFFAVLVYRSLFTHRSPR